MLDFTKRFEAVRSFSKSVRASEYHVTNACNIRCEGCWFFAHEFDKTGNKSGKETNTLDTLRDFVGRERDRGINTALLIGGEPTLFPERVAVYVEQMKYVTISTNGWKPFPKQNFSDVNVAVSLFGGIKSDDKMRAIRPGGKRFTGLFETALQNYRNDERVIFIYAVTPRCVAEVEPTVQRIIDNGNVLTFNYYHDYRADGGHDDRSSELISKLEEVEQKYRGKIASHPEHIRAITTGQSHFGSFGYDSCPSVSTDYPGNRERLLNGNKVLPKFNAWAADLKTVLKCCTSGQCAGCRDSQAVYSWLLVNAEKYATSPQLFATWVEIAESYWAQFTWSPYSLYRDRAAPSARDASETASQGHADGAAV